MKNSLFLLFDILVAGIAGILPSSRLGAALSTSGAGLELRVITAVILGIILIAAVGLDQWMLRKIGK